MIRVRAELEREWRVAHAHLEATRADRNRPRRRERRRQATPLRHLSAGAGGHSARRRSLRSKLARVRVGGGRQHRADRAVIIHHPIPVRLNVVGVVRPEQPACKTSSTARDLRERHGLRTGDNAAAESERARGLSGAPAAAARAGCTCSRSGTSSRCSQTPPSRSGFACGCRPTLPSPDSAREPAACTTHRS